VYKVSGFVHVKVTWSRSGRGHRHSRTGGRVQVVMGVLASSQLTTFNCSDLLLHLCHSLSLSATVSMWKLLLSIHHTILSRRGLDLPATNNAEADLWHSVHTLPEWECHEGRHTTYTYSCICLLVVYNSGLDLQRV